MRFVADAHRAIDSIDLDERDIDLAANYVPKLPDASPIKLVFICNPNNPTGNCSAATGCWR